jgi:hypothetical protein
MNTDKLIQALDEENNEVLFNYTTKKIKEMNLNILKELMLPRETILEYIKQLNGYMYIDEVNQLKIGAFIRWIPIKNPQDLPLKKGALVCDIKITDTGVAIVMKSFLHSYFQIKMDECLVFQKLTEQQQVLLSALDHLSS